MPAETRPKSIPQVRSGLFGSARLDEQDLLAIHLGEREQEFLRVGIHRIVDVVLGSFAIMHIYNSFYFVFFKAFCQLTSIFAECFNNWTGRSFYICTAKATPFSYDGFDFFDDCFLLHCG